MQGDGVHAGGRGEHGRQAQRQLGIANGHARHEVPGVKAELAPVLDDEDGAARHLAAGAAGGGHGHDGGDFVGDAVAAAFDGGVVPEWAGMGGGDGNALGAIDGRAAAHGDQAIAAVLLVKLGGRAHGRFGGVGRRLGKNDEKPVSELLADGFDDARVDDARVGDDQRALHADALALQGKLRNGAEIELDLGDVVDEGHDLSPPGRLEPLQKRRWSAQALGRAATGEVLKELRHVCWRAVMCHRRKCVSSLVFTQ